MSIQIHVWHIVARTCQTCVQMPSAAPTSSWSWSASISFGTWKCGIFVDIHRPPGKYGSIDERLSAWSVTNKIIIERDGASTFPKQMHKGLLTARRFCYNYCFRSSLIQMKSFCHPVQTEYGVRSLLWYHTCVKICRSATLCLSFVVVVWESDQREPKFNRRKVLVKPKILLS